jgi:cation diffusion facilitator CzcD-associated flavoprotein CzcO
MGCKRLVMSPGFYEAIQQPRTALVTERIERVEPNGIRTIDGTLHELDLLVLATGFTVDAYIRPVALFGRGGRSLDEVWAERPVAYHSIAVPDMPNFFMLEGPFSPIGNLSVILISEWQADYVMRCIEIIRRDNVAISPTEQATAEIIKRYRDEARHTVWARDVGGCQSWYQDDEGVPMIYPFTPHDFRDETSADPNLADFLVEDLHETASDAAAQ